VASQVNSAQHSTQLTARIRATRPAVHSPGGFCLDVSLSTPPGITIVFGASGAGKSTLLDAIAGLLLPDAGRIAIGDHTLFDSAERVNLPPRRRRIAYVFQSLALFPNMTVEENIAYGLADLPQPSRSARIDEILRAFHIDTLRTRRPAAISGGEQQRVALARSLVTLPRLLLLDEPLNGLDASLKSSIVEDLRAWNNARKIPILYVTHARDEVDALGERVIVLDYGKVVSEGLPHQALAASRHLPIAQSAGFENVLDATVTYTSEADGFTRVRLDGGPSEIEIPLGYASPNDRVKVAIHAGDILLATQRPVGLSARNILEGNILSLDQRGTVVVARVTAGAVFTVHITPVALRSLGLSAGQPVWLIIKTHSCHVVSP
jgi:molybdate transport system ATP-binding protein